MKSYILNILFIIFFASVVNSQEQEYDRHYKQILLQADDEYIYNNYSVALPLYNELYEIDSANFEINYKIGTCIFYTNRDKLKSLKYFEKAKTKYVDSYFYLGRLYRIDNKFKKSLEAFNIYKNTTEVKQFNDSTVEFFLWKTINAKKMLGTISHYTVTNAGSNINTAYPEYGPLITSDETKLFFTSRKPGGMGNLKDPNNDFFEDIYYSNILENEFSNAKNLGLPINSPSHDATVCLSNDNAVLYIYRTNKNLTGGDIFTSKLEANKFSEPKIIEAEINSPEGAESSACLAPDQKTLYFSSNRAGGYGGKDIYKVVKLPNDKWSKAINLGSIINSPHDEDAPFIQADGVTLYFSSRGLKNIGGYDIFKTVKDDKGKWSFPENMGTPINSVSDDIFFVANPEGTAGYFSSNRAGGFGASDIYKAEFPDEFTENILLKGRVECERLSIPIKATITIVNYDTKELHGIYRTNSISGKFIMVLLPKRHYKLIVEADGYRSFIDDIDMKKKLRIQDLFKSIKLELIEDVSKDKTENEVKKDE